MSINLTLSNLIDVLALIQGLVVGVWILLMPGEARRAQGLLGLFLIVGSLELLNALADDMGWNEAYPVLLFMPVNFYFLSAPLLYRYAEHISGLFRPYAGQYRLYFPGVLEFGLSLVLFLLPAARKQALQDNIWFDGFYFLYVFAGIAFSVYFLVRILRLVRRIRAQAEAHFSFLQNKTLNWVRGVALLMIGFYGLAVLVVIGFVGFDQFEEGLYLLLTLANAAVIYITTLSGVRQTYVFQPREAESVASEEAEVPPPSKPLLAPAEVETLYARLLQVMTTAKPYTDPALSLSLLADQVDLHPKQLSYVINQKAKANFFRFVNQYRVVEAQHLIRQNRHTYLDLAGVGLEAGFGSKSSFNAHFKRIVGKTPKEFAQDVVKVA